MAAAAASNHQRQHPLPPPLPRRTHPPTHRPGHELIINREKIGSHHRVEDVAVRGKEPKGEVQIYTRRDATLHKLIDLVGTTHSTARRLDNTKALVKLSFQIGDYLDVAIL